MEVFNARTNWLCLMDHKDRETLWATAVEEINNYSNTEINKKVLAVFKTLLNSEYVKLHFIYCVPASVLFTKMFTLFMDTSSIKEDALTLFRGPLKTISYLFTPMEYSYRGVEYGNSGDDPTFDDLMKETVDDPGFWDPRNSQWIGKMIP